MFNKKDDVDKDVEEKDSVKSDTSTDSAKKKESKKAPAKNENKAISGSRVNVTSIWPGRVIVRDCPSGEEYLWEKSGDVRSVLSEDVPHLEEKNRMQEACCGGGQVPRHYFAFDQEN